MELNEKREAAIKDNAVPMFELLVRRLTLFVSNDHSLEAFEDDAKLRGDMIDLVEKIYKEGL